MAKSTPRKKTVKKKPARSTKPKPAEKEPARPLRPSRIAIVGKAPSSRALAPYSDGDCEIWTLSNLVAAKEVPRFDRHFELHPVKAFQERAKQGDNYWEWLKSITDKPIYLKELHPEIPSGVLFPKDEIIKRFGTYFTNTVSWMIALAIAVQPKWIGVYGVDMAQNEEYATQRPSCEFFLGYAAGAGIDIHVPKEADMLKCRSLYGFETDGGQMRDKCKERRAELRQRIATHQEKSQQQREKAVFLSGALEGMDWNEQWING